VKEIAELNFPDTVRYAETHEWAGLDGDRVFVGITDYAQDHLGDITFVELPQVGDVFHKGEQFGTVESVKAVSELFVPIGGEILEVNTDLADSPDLVNSDPYSAGWMLQVKPQRVDELESLMTADAYRNFVEGLE
jgi:glycine cleavage system H protein